MKHITVYFPTLGRFAQMDPIPGGNANDYVYPADPINSSDISGMLSVGVASCNCTIRVVNNYGMQYGAGGNSLQSSPTASKRIQNAATVVVQGSGRVTNSRITVAKSPKKNKGTLAKEKRGMANSGSKSTVNEIVTSDTGQFALHQIVGGGLGFAAGTGVVACAATIGCGAAALAIGGAGLLVAGTGAHYAVSSDENRQLGVGHWAGEALLDVSVGATCGFVFKATCLAAARKGAGAVWRYVRN